MLSRRDTFKLLSMLTLASTLDANPIDNNLQSVVLPRNKLEFKRKNMALLVINPQNDYLSPDGVGWEMYGASIKEQNTVKNITSMLNVAKYMEINVMISHQSFESHDYSFMPNSPFFNFIKGTKMLSKDSKGSDFVEDFKPFINDKKTIILSPNKRMGVLNNNLVLELKSRDINQVIICGMDAEVSISTTLRELVSLNFEVTVITDAIAGAKIPEGDSYASALTSFRYLAGEILSTQDFIQRMQ